MSVLNTSSGIVFVGSSQLVPVTDAGAVPLLIPTNTFGILVGPAHLTGTATLTIQGTGRLRVI